MKITKREEKEIYEWFLNCIKKNNYIITEDQILLIYNRYINLAKKNDPNMYMDLLKRLMRSEASSYNKSNRRESEPLSAESSAFLKKLVARWE